MTNPLTFDDIEHRQMTDDEYAQYLDLQNAIAKQEAQIAAQIAAKESARTKLAALGLTIDEINALIA